MPTACRSGSAVRCGAIDHSGKRVSIETADGTITADAVIVTLSSNLIAEEAIRFTPALPREGRGGGGPAARSRRQAVPVARRTPEEFEKDSRLFGRTDRTAIGAYHFRPFGRPQIEAYFGGTLAAELEASGEGAFFDFALSELTSLFGSDFAHRVKPIRMHCWGIDPYAARLILPCPARQGRLPRACSRRRSTIGCSSPARPARCTTTRPRTALISPASPPRIR